MLDVASNLVSTCRPVKMYAVLPTHFKAEDASGIADAGVGIYTEVYRATAAHRKGFQSGPHAGFVVAIFHIALYI